jgi:ankyrin repeat protein
MSVELHIVWGASAADRARNGQIDDTVRLAHAVYSFPDPNAANLFLYGAREARPQAEFFVVRDPRLVARLGRPLRTHLVEAIEAGDLERVDRILRTGINVNAPDGQGLRPLHHAARSGNAAVIVSLLKAGANADSPAEDSSGDRPIHYLARSPAPGAEHAVASLLESSPGNTRSANGRTPVHEACAALAPRMLMRLLALGESALLRDDEGQSPLALIRSAHGAGVIDADGQLDHRVEAIRQLLEHAEAVAAQHAAAAEDQRRSSATRRRMAPAPRPDMRRNAATAHRSRH